MIGFAIVLVLCGSGCSGDGEARVEGCSSKKGAPIDADAAMAEITQASFQAEEESCDARGIVSQINNAGSSNEEDVGHIVCKVYDRVQPGVGAGVRETRLDSEAFELTAANVRCVLFVRGDNPQGQVASVKRALTRMVENG